MTKEPRLSALPQPASEDGFTLVELSIVLVIIGLLIGGILAAQSMIRSTKVNRQVQQIQNIEVTVSNFFTTYNSLPGDSLVIGETNVGGSTGQPARVCAGNGDGMIGNNFPVNPTGNETWGPTDPYYCYSYNQEWGRVFEHLGVTGKLKWDSYDDSIKAQMHVAGIGYPIMALGVADPVGGANSNGGLVIGWIPDVGYIKAGNKIVIGACKIGGYIHFRCGPIQADAAAIDFKMDDGRPYSGKVYIIAPIYPLRVFGGLIDDETSGCGNSSNNSYRLNAAVAPCAVTIDPSF